MRKIPRMRFLLLEKREKAQRGRQEAHQIDLYMIDL